METILETKNLTKIFNPETRAQVAAVADVNLKLSKGEILMIMGPSGSGKTTLLTMLGGLLRPSNGEIVFNGQAFGTLGGGALAKLRRKKLGFIFQIQDDILDNQSVDNSDEILKKSTYISILGLEKSNTVLSNLKQECLNLLKDLNLKKNYLNDLTLKIFERTS